MELRFKGLTDTGILRSVNQDDYYLDESQRRFFIVFDGMGGHAGGQEASRIATKEIRTHLEEHWDSPFTSDILLKESLERANQGILEDQQNHPEREEMGTTAVVLLFRQGEVWCAHVGDSRLYCFRDSKLEQITKDHTWVAKAQKLGELTPAEARRHPWRHVLSQCFSDKTLIYSI